MLLFIFIIVSCLISLILTWCLRLYALRHSMMDIPNERSSHDIPTPRGGGLAIVLTFLLGLFVLKMAGFLPAFLFWALFGSGSWVALIGWMDDRHDIPARVRLIGHFIGAVWALFCLGGLPPLPVFGNLLYLSWIGHILAVFYLVWLLNLYNFMDGINGIAGIEAISVCIGGVVLLKLASAGNTLWVLPMLIVSATMGFLFWNFPVARIFMGDVGSGFMGMVFGILSIWLGWIKPELFWAWIILLGAFIVDASVTLVRRALRAEKVYEAHRSHAYQHAAQIYGHPPVSLAYGAINLFWLLPVAVLVVMGLLDGILGVVIAYLPLVVGVFAFKGGLPE
ncbi:MAG: glycosyltransferase family 4 protein [Bacteroidetes bacterium]|nr:glycosyltransferase family 4 protein [Bacteroidota bacterium]